MAGRVLICLGAGLEGVPILLTAKRMGHRLVVVDANPNAPGMALADVPLVASCYDADLALDAVSRNAEVVAEADGILCCATDSPRVAATIAEYLHLPGLTVEQASLSVDKVEQAMALSKAGLTVPDFSATFYGAVTVPSGNIVPLDLNPDDMARMGDVVIKPADSRGGRGVARLFAPRGDYGPVFKACEYARQFSKSGKLIGQKYLPGPQLSTESIVVDGRVLFTAVGLRNYDRLDEFAPHIIEDGFDMPYGDDALLDEVHDIIERGCAALGWRNLSVKCDLIIHDGRVVILEMAARLSGGFFSTHGTALAYGYDLIGDSIRIALGQPVYVEHSGVARQYVSQRYVFPGLGDIGKRVASVPDIVGGMLVQNEGYTEKAVGFMGESVKYATYAVHEGDILRPVTDHGARLGQAIAVGATPEIARQQAEAAVRVMQTAIVLSD